MRYNTRKYNARQYDTMEMQCNTVRYDMIQCMYRIDQVPFLPFVPKVEVFSPFTELCIHNYFDNVGANLKKILFRPKLGNSKLFNSLIPVNDSMLSIVPDTNSSGSVTCMIPLWIQYRCSVMQVLTRLAFPPKQYFFLNKY